MELVSLTPTDANVTYEVQDEETLEVTEVPDTNEGRSGKRRCAVSGHGLQGSVRRAGYLRPTACGCRVFRYWSAKRPGKSRRGRLAQQGLILDGIVAGVGAVLGFVPQMLVLFLLLAFLEALRLYGAYRIRA